MIGILKLISILLLSASLFLFLFSQLAIENSLTRRMLNKYISGLESDLKFIRSQKSGKYVTFWQALVLLAVITASINISPIVAILLPIIAIAPTLQLRTLRDRRIVRIEQQLDSWLLILANALKAVPSIGDALESSRSLAHAPISEEVDIVIKENELGTPLDVSLQNMSKRLKSRVVSAALTTLQIARRTGGDLPTTLETSAASLREMARLEGVIRTKTADGRNQAFVLGSLPAIIIVLLYFAYPELIMQLINTPVGNILIAIAGMLWIGAIFTALKILDVDI